MKKARTSKKSLNPLTKKIAPPPAADAAAFDELGFDELMFTVGGDDGGGGGGGGGGAMGGGMGNCDW